MICSPSFERVRANVVGKSLAGLLRDGQSTAAPLHIK